MATQKALEADTTTDLIQLQNGFFNPVTNTLFIHGFKIQPTKVMNDFNDKKVHDYLAQHIDEGVIDQNKTMILMARLNDKGVKL